MVTLPPRPENSRSKLKKSYANHKEAVKTQQEKFARRRIRMKEKVYRVKYQP
jgi:hypothetical protein